jgi:hypothetical protein
LIGENVYDSWRHHVANGRRVRIAAAGDAAQGNIAIRHHSSESIVHTHGQRPDIELAHQSSGINKRVLGPDAACMGSHDFVNFHTSPSYADLPDSAIRV